MKYFKTGMVFLTIVGSLVLISVVGLFFFKSPPVIIQGEVDATEFSVSSKIAGRVETVFVKDGETVKKGQLLINLDCPEIKARLNQALSVEKAASAQQDKVYKGSRVEEIQVAFKMWLTNKTTADLARKTFDRMRRLHGDGVVSTQKYDEAKANMIAAREAAGAAKASYDMAIAGARQEDKTTAMASVAKSAALVSEVRAYLDETHLSAPIDGEVTECIVHPGEIISPGYPLVSMVDRSDIWVSFNLREDLLTKIRMGSILSARLPALGNQKVTLHVTYISVLGDFATWHATKASGDFDLKTFEVRARPDSPVPGLRPGMSALVNWDQISGAPKHNQ